MANANRKFNSAFLTILLLAVLVAQPIIILQSISVIDTTANGQNLPTYSALEDVNIILPVLPKSVAPLKFHLVENFKKELTHSLSDENFELYAITQIHTNKSPFIIYKNPPSQFTSEQ